MRDAWNRYSRWTYKYWWPWVTAPSFAALVLLLLDPTEGDASSVAWTLGSALIPAVISVVWWRGTHPRV